MRKIVYISFYLWIGLYIIWDSTMLLDFESTFSRRSATAHNRSGGDQFNFPNHIRTGLSNDDLIAQYTLAEEQISLLYNQDQLIPFTELAQKRFFLLTVGSELPEFESYLNRYAYMLTDEVVSVTETNLNYLGYFDPIILALNSAVEDSVSKAFIHKLAGRTNVVVVNFQPLKQINRIGKLNTWLQVSHNDPLSQMLAAQMLFGGRPTSSMVPVMTGLNQPEMLGEQTHITRLSYGIPELMGVPAFKLSRIDSIVAEGIADTAMPGCQVLIAKSGQVLYHKAFGYHTYEKERPVQLTDLYDVASITKVAATTLAAMKLYEEGKLKLDTPLKNYFDYQLVPEAERVWDTLSYKALLTQLDNATTPLVLTEEDTVRYKDSLIILGHWESVGIPKVPAVLKATPFELLTHTSGLQPSLSLSSFFTHARKTGHIPRFPYKNSTYFSEYTPETGNVVWQTTMQLPLGSTDYRYSDINMMMMRRLIDSLTQQQFSLYLNEQFYQELGLRYTCFNPLTNFDRDQIVPTEYNRLLDTLIHGIVHDPVAALMGGEAGHAGLFSNANDMAIIMQMLANGGTYGGHQYLLPETIAKFTRSYGHARGLGFDKPPLDRPYIIARSASVQSFGHTGFTGTCVWADPEHELVYVFLSNRVHPDAKNRRINILRIRERIHQVVYDALDIPMRPFKDVRKYPTYFTKSTSQSSSPVSMELEDAR